MPKTLQEYAASSKSASFATKTNQFFSGGGKVEYTSSGFSHYEPHIANGLVQGGKLVINTNDVEKLARAAGISVDDAYIETFAHELGHFSFAPYDISVNVSTASARMSLCYTREGEASTFAFTVALENHGAGGALGVAGVSGNWNMFGTLNATYNSLIAQGYNPASTVFANQFSSAATNVFAHDPGYQAFCSKYAADPNFSPFLLPDSLSELVGNDPAPADLGNDGGGNDDGGGYGGDDGGDGGDGGDDGGDYGGGDDGGGGGGGDGGCVSIDARLPGGGIAGEIRVGDTMELADEKTLAPATGEVTYSKTKSVPGFRITTEGGVSLKCSDTAPIPTPEGLVQAPELLGKMVPVRIDVDGIVSVRWEKVVSVDAIGTILVQHITVGDRCFWAGEKAGAYILHHNLKDAGGGDDPWPDDDWLTTPASPAPGETARGNGPYPPAESLASPPAPDGGHHTDAVLVGQAPPSHAF